MKPIECRYYELCTTLYKKKELKKSCHVLNDSVSVCKLIQDIQDDKINQFVLSLIAKKADSPTEKGELQKIKCPRSLVSGIELSHNCPLQDCPFYSKKLAYNCFLIHQDIFFYDYKYIPKKILEVGTEIDKKTFDRLISISVYLCRLYIVLIKYKMTYTRISKTKIGSNKKLKRLFFSSRSYVCPICSGIYLTECDCVKDGELRNQRIKFNKGWTRKITQCNHKVLANTNLDLMDAKTFNKDYTIYSLKLIRSLIGTVNHEGLFIKDLPFGYIFNLYHVLFQDRETKIAENLGLTTKLYRLARKLFPNPN